MTIYQLHKALGKLIESGHKRIHVAIDKQTFSHPLEGDGYVILPIEELKVEWIPHLDGDGFQEFNKDGSERGSWRLVLKGEA